MNSLKSKSAKRKLDFPTEEEVDRMPPSQRDRNFDRAWNGLLGKLQNSLEIEKRRIYKIAIAQHMPVNPRCRAALRKAGS